MVPQGLPHKRAGVGVYVTQQVGSTQMLRHLSGFSSKVTA
jgi:hypothetical protein